MAARRPVLALLSAGVLVGLFAALCSMPRKEAESGRAAGVASPGTGKGVSTGTGAATPEGTAARGGKQKRMVDAHVHLAPGGESRLFALMKQHGVAHVINLSGGHPLGGLSKQLAAAKGSGGRITVFTGFPYEQAERPGYGQRMANILRLGHEMGAKGLKIAKALGLGLPDPKGRLMPVDDPELDVVFETAGELGMPIAIHSGDPKAFWQPVNEKNERFDELTAHPGWALHGKSVPSFDEIQNQLERRVARHPKTRFISVHFGNCAEDIVRVGNLLRKYPNLYVDTAARIPEMGRHRVEDLRALFIEFQDRILYGSDLGVGPEPEPLFLGSSGASDPTPAEEALFFSATRRFFETTDRNFAHPTPIQGRWKIDGIGLPDDVLEKVYARNAMRLLGIEFVP